MRIGINCVNIDPDYVGGVNTYLFGLLDGFIHHDRKHTYQLYVNSKVHSLFEKYETYAHVTLIDLGPSFKDRPERKVFYLPGINKFYPAFDRWVNRKNNRLIEQYSDILYIATTLLSPHGLKIPTVTSIHDIQQFHFPEYFSLKEKMLRNTFYGPTVQYSSFIQASSQFIQKDLIVHYPKRITKDRIVVIPEGVNIETFSKNNISDDLLTKYNLPIEFLFYPAQLWPHKNHLRLLEALKMIRDRSGIEIPLVLTGGAFKAAPAIFNYIKQHDMENQVHYLGKVPFIDLLCLYQKAKYLVTAVLYESSSLTILEAAASGTSILASDTPPNREMSERLEIRLFDPIDVSKIVEVIQDAWTQRNENHISTVNNKNAVQYYSWKNIARQYINFFQSILS
jgi:glycosyltransferase involved in cell wall biosynthesis